MPKRRKNKRGPTRPKKRGGGRGQVLRDFKEFKRKLHRWVDRTKINWEGEPWHEGSKYSFVLDEELVKAVIGILQRAHQEQHAERAQALAQERNDSLKKMLDLSANKGIDLEEITQTEEDTETTGQAEEEAQEEEG